MTINIYRNTQNRLFFKNDNKWIEIIHPDSPEVCDEIFEELVSPQGELIYPDRQNIGSLFKNPEKFPELKARVLALEPVNHPWIDTQSGNVLGIDCFNA
jgi:hypothetical protein